jgi:hypothetical protein
MSVMIVEKYGQPISHWKAILETSGLQKHLEMVNLLKTAHGMGRGHANAIVGDFRQERGLYVAPSNGRSSFIRATPSTQGVTGEWWRRTGGPLQKREARGRTREVEDCDLVQSPLLPPL